MEFLTADMIEKLMQYPILLIMLYFIWIGQKNTVKMIDVLCELIKRIDKHEG